MEQLQLDWSTAEVSDGKLTVGLSGKSPKKWRDAFERTAALLGAGTWEVTLNSKKGSVRVASVQPGDAERVRHFLEGVVLEANTTLVSEQELFGSPPVEDDEPEPHSDAPEPSRDEELTDRFREFGREQGNDDD
jgi:hypothetical protein